MQINKYVLASVVASAALLILPVALFASSVISNGSFENGSTNPGSYLTVNAGDSTTITDWTVNSGSVDWIGTYWKAADGNNSIDLNGIAQGSISQTFSTTPGTAYTVTFSLSGNPDSSSDLSLASPSLKDVQVSATGGSPQDFTFNTSSMGNSEAKMMWQPESYSFTANSSNTTLTFASQIAGAFGPALDNVVVTQNTPTCTPSGFYRDGINLTAAVIDPASPVTNAVDATGCNVGVYFGPGKTGSVTGANIHGANYYGIVNNEGSVNVTNSQIHDIGETPLNGDQHGVSIYYANVLTSNPGAGNQPACDTNPSNTTTGTISGNTLTNYQKGGIVINCAGASATISNNTVTGQGPVPYIAQNGIEIARGATGTILNNTVTGNEYNGSGSTAPCGYSPPGGPDPICDTQSAGVLLYQAGDGVQISGNTVTNNDVGVYNNLAGSGTTVINGNNQITGGYDGIEYDQGNANIDSNAITGSDVGIAGLSFTGNTANSSALVTRNTITGQSDSGIKLLDQDTTDAFTPTLTANNNNLSSDALFGIDNTNAPLADGTCNWWGNANGPGTVGPGSGSDVTTNVTYNPWLVSSDLSGSCTGGLSVSVTTNSATAITSGGATLNGTDGPVAGDNTSFWWGTTPLTGLTPGGNVAEFPATNWTHDTGLSPVSAGGAFNEPLTGLTPGIPYYFVAWVEVGGTWYPGQVLSFIMPVTTAQCPVGTVEATGAIDSFIVDSSNSSPTSGSQVLTSGQPYIVTASGTWQNSSINVANPMYSSLDSWTTYQEGYDTTPYFLGPDEFNLMVNNAFVNWGVYDGTSHTYSTLYTGTNSPVNLMVFDGDSTLGPVAGVNSGWYGDNNGSLSVSVYPCVPTTGTFTVEKSTVGGNNTFNFTGTGSIGSFQITTTGNSPGGSGYSQTFTLAPGNYTITEGTQPHGWTQTDSDCTNVSVTAGGAATCTITDTSNKLLGVIRGTKYEDRDGDGTLKDGDHHRLPGVTIQLTGPGTQTQTTVTDSHGNYQFVGLVAGHYTVSEQVPLGWIETVPASGSYSVNLSAGQVVKHENFGDFHLGVISGMKYNDANGDGRKDNGEVGLPGWTIQLKKGNSVVATTVTATDGSYSFANLGPGMYTLSEVAQPTWTQIQHPGPVKIQSGTNATNENFGNTQHPKHDNDDFWGGGNNGHGH